MTFDPQWIHGQFYQSTPKGPKPFRLTASPLKVLSHSINTHHATFWRGPWQEFLSIHRTTTGGTPCRTIRRSSAPSRPTGSTILQDDPKKALTLFRPCTNRCPSLVLPLESNPVGVQIYPSFDLRLLGLKWKQLKKPCCPKSYSSRKPASKRSFV